MRSWSKLSGPTLQTEPVELDEEAVDIVGADASFCAILRAGSVRCWGKSSEILQAAPALKCFDATPAP